MKRENVVVYATAEQKEVLKIRAADAGIPIGVLLDERYKALASTSIKSDNKR